MRSVLSTANFKNQQQVGYYQYMEQHHQVKYFASIIIALIVGVGAGYYYGNRVGIQLGINQEKAVEEAAKADAAKQAAAAINPFNKETNPLNQVKINPFQ